MTEYLRVEGERAVELWAAPHGKSPADLFHPDLAATFHPRGNADLGWVWSGSAFEAPPAPEPDPRPVITSKADLFRRCTDDEAEAIEAALQALPVRKRRIFEGAQYVSSADPDFDELRVGLVTLFGAERAAELLAAS